MSDEFQITTHERCESKEEKESSEWSSKSVPEHSCPEFMIPTVNCAKIAIWITKISRNYNYTEHLNKYSKYRNIKGK